MWDDICDVDRGEQSKEAAESSNAKTGGWIWDGGFPWGEESARELGMTVEELLEDAEIGEMVEEIEWLAWLMRVWEVSDVTSL